MQQESDQGEHNAINQMIVQACSYWFDQLIKSSMFEFEIIHWITLNFNLLGTTLTKHSSYSQPFDIRNS